MKNEKKINDISAHLQTMLVSSLLPLNQILCKQKKYVKKKPMLQWYRNDRRKPLCW